ncbi:MAG: hypothetical protein KBG20_03470 [Caldilineaceae bacterium]|nr:hypothetical protein [Caldilineaceae bacterium]MBP8108588.1 hypothetical protein [Caldilineaceae bacterium]MBP8124199.1 hypothetical protein [Caldilineaceae bacterium]MBP9071327.1 hypothetical protein [Caldilineaceae bacterium]
MHKIRQQLSALHASTQPSAPLASQPWGELSETYSSIGGRGRLRWAILVMVTLLAATVLSACFSLFPGLGQTVAPTATQVANAGPSLSLDPASGYAGVYVRVNGQGWPASTMVILALQDGAGRSGILAASTSANDGTVNTGFLYPISDRWLVPGPNTVIAYTADGNLQATTAFQVVRPGTDPITTTLTTTPSPTATTASGGAVISTPTATATNTSAPANSPTPTQTNTNTPLPTETPINTATHTPQPTAILFTDWRADFWANPDLSGPPALTRNDVAVSFDWALASPGTGLPEDNFSARWSRSLNFDAGLYRFIFQVDDGVRFYIDDQLVLDEWRDGSLRTQSVERSLTQGIHTLRVDYYERTGKATIRFAWERQETITGWKGEYYPNPDLLGVPVLVRDDAAIDFQWGIDAPAPGLPVDGFSVRWSRNVTFETGSYRFFLRADDGIRLWIDGVPVLEEWHDSSVTTYVADVDLGAGVHVLRVEYYENTLGARAEFWWQSIPRPTPTWTATWTQTPLPSSTPTWTPFPTSVPTATATPLPTNTATVTHTPTWTFTPESPATSAPQVEPTQTPTLTPTHTATATATSTPTSTATSTPTEMPTATATALVESTAEAPVDLTELTAIAFVPHRIGLDLRPEQATYRLFTDAEAWARFVLDNLRTRADAAVGRVAPPVKSADDAKAATPIAPLPLGIDPDVVEQLGEGVDFDSQALIFVSPGAMPAGSGIRIEQVYWEDARPEQAGRVYVQVAFTSLSIRSKFLRTVYPNDVVIFNTSELGQQIPEMVPEVIFVDTDGKVLENQLWLELAPSVDDTK